MIIDGVNQFLLSGTSISQSIQILTFLLLNCCSHQNTIEERLLLIQTDVSCRLSMLSSTSTKMDRSLVSLQRTESFWQRNVKSIPSCLCQRRSLASYTRSMSISWRQLVVLWLMLTTLLTTLVSTANATFTHITSPSMLKS